MNLFGTDHVERALKALERIAKAMEDANKIEVARQENEHRLRRARALT